MTLDTKIDFVAPPFAGHLFPLLDLACQLRQRGLERLRVHSTTDGGQAIGLCGLTGVELLPGHDAKIKAIANTSAPVGFNPLRLYRQFQMNMSMMQELFEQLGEIWSADRPDLVFADFTVPVAGLRAESMGIPWWTSSPSPCVMESLTGTPSYLGGWMPRTDLLGRLRDACGRRLIRWFKLGVARLFSRQLRRIGFKGVYRSDGYEAIYSPRRILGLGMREFEFERDWPTAFRFIGPLTDCPPFAHVPPEFPPGKKAILVTLGTHLPWARKRAAELLERVASLMPDCVFHFAQGSPGQEGRSGHGNLHHYAFIPYSEYMPRYDVAVIHGGTGIIYECIKAAVPMLVWPQDFDQDDHAARIVQRGLGLRLRPRSEHVVADLRRLFADEPIRQQVGAFQKMSRKYDPCGWVLDELQRERLA